MACTSVDACYDEGCIIHPGWRAQRIGKVQHLVGAMRGCLSYNQRILRPIHNEGQKRSIWRDRGIDGIADATEIGGQWYFISGLICAGEHFGRAGFQVELPDLIAFVDICSVEK